MNRATAALFLGALLVVLTACGSSPETAGEDTSTMQTSTQAEQPGRTNVSSLPDTMPLLPIMVQLERDMQSISSGLWRHDFEQIAASADNIANHPKIQPDQVKTIRSILGDTQFKTFVRDDKKVHNMALELREAAREQDFKRAAETYQNLEQGCISCHLSHRNTIRDSPRWSQP